jgi:SAM-dependent methyltransferase
MFVCPDCKARLENLFCNACQRRFLEVDGIPVLLSKDQRYDMAGKIGSIYDDVYKNRSKVWEDQGRTPEFIAYFAKLAASLSTGNVLEIGCGEGLLLSSLGANQLAAIDLSSEALRKALARVQVVCCVGLAERLPFPDESFHLVLTVGVMEHFLNDREATREISRVLKPLGHYLVLLHVHLSVWESIRQKIREYVYPRMRPVALVKWILKKLVRPISQPIQRQYSRQTAQACLEECGFVVKEIINTRSHSDTPLIGPHVFVFIASKI